MGEAQDKYNASDKEPCHRRKDRLMAISSIEQTEAWDAPANEKEEEEVADAAE